MLHHTLLTGMAILTLILIFTSLGDERVNVSGELSDGVRVSSGSPEGSEGFSVIEASSVRDVLSDQNIRAVTQIIHLERDERGEWTVSKREVLVKNKRRKD